MRSTDEAPGARSFKPGPSRHGVRDVTNDFIAASKRLQPGQLIKDEYFTLFEAVGALEIMDAKMDSGYVPPDDLFDPDFDVSEAISPAEIAWIMDQLLCSEMSWHDGYPLSQTVFMSLHMDHLLAPENKPPYTFLRKVDHTGSESFDKQLVDRLLLPYCVAVAKCCELTIHTIQRQNYYEEEDFITNLYGRELLPTIDADQACDMLDEALEWLETCGMFSEEMLYVLLTRLRFRAAYLTSIFSDDKMWTALEVILQDTDLSHPMTQAIPNAFSEKVQRRLASSTPPRPMLTMSWDDAIDKWKSMCLDLAQVDVSTGEYISQSPHALQRATWAFAYREPPPNAYARACLQERLFGNDQIAQGISHFDLFLSDIRDLVLAGDPLVDPASFQIEMPSDPRHSCSRIMENFMDRAFEEYLNIYRMVCQNRCRMRRTFTQAVPLLDGLQTEAENCDNAIAGIIGPRTLTDEDGSRVSAKPLMMWTRFYKLQIMEWVLQLGIETDIYLDDEYAMTYWLLHHVTCERIKTIKRAQQLIKARLEGLAQTMQPNYYAEGVESQEWLECLLAFTTVTRILSGSLSKLFSILMVTGVLLPPRRDYAEQDLLFEARMKPFLNLSNDPIPTVADFAAEMRAPTNVEVACAEIARDIKQAKILLASLKGKTPKQAKCAGTWDEWLTEIKQLETTCVAVAVQASQLEWISSKYAKQAPTRDFNLEDALVIVVPKPEDAYHRWWVVPQIKAKRTD